MTESETSGGQARLIVAADGAVSGSVVDEVWARTNAAPRTGELRGEFGISSSVRLDIHWSNGPVDAYEGSWTSHGANCLGLTASKHKDGNPEPGTKITFYLSEQGSAARPPYGVAPDRSAPDFLAQFAGRWSMNWYDSAGDWGTGVFTITADGKLTGSLANDSYSDGTEPAPMRSGTAAGAVDAQGFLGLTITWDDGSSESLGGAGYFEGPEEMTFTVGRDPRELAKGGPRLVFNLDRR
ncbi:MAG: hypothetical protein EXS00_03800 [Phycisphaerales bacterium]|nr:hypothetical protein [Phycisphaerales bacterium]